MQLNRGVLLGLAFTASGLIAASCFKGPRQSNPTCLQVGTCQCMQKSDCATGLDCLDGFCADLHPDAGPGQIGALCGAGADCASNLCLPRGPGNGGVCSDSCDGGAPCPLGWDCKASTLGPPWVCAPPFDSLCLPCNVDSDCNPVGDLCLDLGGKRACGRDCSVSPCPDGYTCTQLTTDAGASSQCVPNAGTCDCTDLSLGLTRSCTNRDPIGVCFGRERCQADGGWTACDARTASAEVCNGIDDDCNGLVDQNDPGLVTSGLPTPPAYPTCQKGSGGDCLGTWQCASTDGGPVGWSCTARNPTPEVCNGVDDDCDGIIDGPFRDDAGLYDKNVHDCGSCGYDCDVAIANLAMDAGTTLPIAVACDLRNGVPTCVPTQCAPGSYLFPAAEPVLCQKDVSSSCRPCVTNADCAVPGDQCLTIGTDPGTFCAQNCDVSSPYGGCTGEVGARGCCPSGYTCQASGAAKLCFPDGNSCQCNASRVGFTRSCIKVAPTNSCVGLETCTADAGWSVCDTSKTIVELCDGQDNNCSGVIDGPFINTKDSGTYDTDQHCGNCATDCTAMWSPTIQHAIGGCDAGPGRPPACAIFTCTQSAVPGGGQCRVDSDCGSGAFCLTPFYQCARACGSTSDCGGSPCVAGFCTSACTSNAQCSIAYGSLSTCTNGTCSTPYQWVNANQDSSDGCECPAALGVVETPDIYATYPDAGVPYPDRNCDRINGVAATSLFVWSGTPSSQGTQQNPYRTVAEALAAYNPAVQTAILVAEGDYPEQVVLRNGVHLYGGYSGDFLRRDVVSFPSVIEGPEPNFSQANPVLGAVNAVGITQSATFAGFTVRGYDVTYRPAAGRPGENSYGIYVRDSSAALTIANNHVYGGRGGDGSEGAPGVAGVNGGLGLGGRNSVECHSEICNGESQPGGVAGANASCGDANGNPGAGASGGSGVNFQDQQQYTTSSNGDGLGGFNAEYLQQFPSQANLCKYDCLIPNGGINGEPAQDGPDGTPAGAGAGCAMATGGIFGAEWTPSAGTDGARGTDGVGGGGGGAGGCVVNMNLPGCTIGNLVGDLGSTGGGGGAGGCGGSGGAHGGGGGGSFAIFVVFTGTATSLPLVRGNLIEVGSGGYGGAGGPAGYGGLGGAGGAAGTSADPAWCAGNGGHGGRGGNGGAGGGGGGGCGGIAFGIAGNQLGTSRYDVLNTFDPLDPGVAGSPGEGGSSPAGTGSTGTAGASGLVGSFRGF